MNRPVSIKDLARLAGVSHSTVSRALRGSPLVAPEMTKRIRELARVNGYRASLAARSLVTRESRTIGCVVTTLADPFMAEVVTGIESVANRNGYSVLLANSNADSRRELDVVHTLQQHRVDGVVTAASRVGAHYDQALAESQIPLVLINDQQSAGYVHSVSIDNAAAAALLMRHLTGLGHTRIAYIGDARGGCSDRQRLAGYRAALRAARLRYPPEYVEHGDSTPAGGALAMSRLLHLRRPPTAVFCYNDRTALGVLAAIRKAGLQVPRDVSVVGFDDLDLASYTDPPLTTLRQPMRIMGQIAFEILLGLMRGDAAERVVTVQGELIVRQSTAPLRQA